MSRASAQESPVCTPAEAAQLLRVSRPMIYKLAREGQLTFHKIGRSTRLQRSEVLALVGLSQEEAA